MSDPPLSKKDQRAAKRADERAARQRAQDELDATIQGDQSTATSGPLSTPLEPENSQDNISEQQDGGNAANTLGDGLKDLTLAGEQQNHKEKEKTKPKPKEVFPQDPNTVKEGNFLLANHFSVAPGNYRILFKYTMSFQRRETKAERQKREATPKDGNVEEDKTAIVKKRKEPVIKHVGNDTYIEVNPARAKRRRIVRILSQALVAANRTIPIATDYFEQIITAEKLQNTAEGLQVSSDAWIEPVNYFDEYETYSSENSDHFRVTISGPTSLDWTNSANLSARITLAYRPFERRFRLPTLPLSPSPTEETTEQSTQIHQPTATEKPEPAKARMATESKTMTGDPNPILTTKNGTKFHGIASCAILDGNPPQTQDTETGPGKYLEPGTITITGFARSVRTSLSPKGLITLNVHTATSIFYQRVSTLDNLIKRWTADNRGLRDDDALNKFLKNIRVRTNYLPGQENYIGRVTGLAETTPAYTTQDAPFPKRCEMRSPGLTQNQFGTMQQYFQHPTFIRGLEADSEAYVVHVGEKDYLETIPASHLDVIPGQFNRNTDVKPKAGVITPIDNKALVMRARSVLLGTGSGELGGQQFELQVASDLLKVPTKKLLLPGLLYRPKRQTSDRDRIPAPPEGLTYGTWNLLDMKFIEPAKDCRWTYVELILPQSTGCGQAELKAFADNFDKVFKAAGMTGFDFISLEEAHTKSLSFTLPGRNNAAQLKQQDEEIGKILESVVASARMMFVIFLIPSRNQDLYGSIKRAGDQNTGITTFCHVTKAKDDSSAVLKPSNQLGTLANMSMKINLKARKKAVPQAGVNQILAPAGVNQALDPQKLGPILTPKTMIIGIDVTHPGSSAMKDSPSIAAVVGSVDKHFAQWPASLRMQMPVENKLHPEDMKQSVEQVLELQHMIAERLVNYCYRNNRQLPDKLVVYRDGLSEEQFSMCASDEYDAIYAGIGDVMKRNDISLMNGRPQILLICAVKRHHTRCFPDIDSEQVAKSSKRFICHTPSIKSTEFNWNPMPGTCITERITYGKGKDFFLYSQNAIKGTARPTHYIILRDELR